MASNSCLVFLGTSHINQLMLPQARCGQAGPAQPQNLEVLTRTLRFLEAVKIAIQNQFPSLGPLLMNLGVTNVAGLLNIEFSRRRSNRSTDKVKHPFLLDLLQVCEGT